MDWGCRIQNRVHIWADVKRGAYIRICARDGNQPDDFGDEMHLAEQWQIRDFYNYLCEAPSCTSEVWATCTLRMHRNYCSFYKSEPHGRSLLLVPILDKT
jgi:hypothetical protein